MFSTTKRTHLQLSMAPAYLFVCLLIANQLLPIHCYVVLRNDGYQIESVRDVPSDFLLKNQLENQQTNVFRQLLAKYLTNSESSADDYDLQANRQPTVQRRFCCMSPLSGRKRFLRDLGHQRQMPFIEQEQ